MSAVKQQSIWSGIFRKPADWHQQVAELWSHTPFFQGIPLREIIKLSHNMHLRHYEEGEYIFHAGDQGAGAAIILQGDVEIRFQNTALAHLTAGDFFGEIALVLDERRTADAIAVVPVDLVFFLRPEFEEWVNRAPQHGARLSANLAHVLARRLLHTNQMMAGDKP